MGKLNENKAGEVTQQYLDFIDNHLEALVNGDTTDMLELKDIARELHISHQHLIALVQQAKGHHPCYFYDQKIIEKATSMMAAPISTAQIAYKLTYDPSNFSKFFKKMTGKTPGQWRREQETK